MQDIEFSMDAEVAAAFPEARSHLLVARGLHNDQDWPAVDERVSRLADELAAGRLRSFDESDPVVASWHTAFRRFGVNPRRFRPSFEALGRRLTSNGGTLPRINPAVDAYNVVSVTHGTPAGAFDLAGLGRQVTIRFARTGDRFTPLGEPDKVEEVTGGEVVYAQDDQVLTRRWNHRDCDQTKVTAAAREVVFMLERVDRTALPDEALEAAAQDLATLIQPYATELVHLCLDAGTPVAVLAGGTRATAG